MVEVSSPILDDLIEEAGVRIHRGCLQRGDVAVVTGAARGFGRAIARRLAREGATLALWDVQTQEGHHVAELCQSLGAKAEFFHCDLADLDSINELPRPLSAASVHPTP